MARSMVSPFVLQLLSFLCSRLFQFFRQSSGVLPSVRITFKQSLKHFRLPPRPSLSFAQKWLWRVKDSSSDTFHSLILPPPPPDAKVMMYDLPPYLIEACVLPSFLMYPFYQMLPLSSALLYRLYVFSLPICSITFWKRIQANNKIVIQ